MGSFLAASYWGCFKRNSHAVKQACTSGGSACKHTARMMTGGVPKRLLLCMVGFKNDSEAVEQACTRLTTAGGCGGPQPAPFANRMLAWLVSKKHMLSSKLAQAGGWWGAAPPPRPLCKYTARMVNGAVSIRLILCMASCKNDTEAVKQAYTRLRTAGGGGGGQPPSPFANTMLA